ncbi:hypothetical protein [Leptotrichia buccalis]|uniref:Uncharacterized protein n=1 Tax=Leptotrichia buccalis (strain ATCC 14201 / DSM 1135 / JCM 12969 / NCTC 10249 / C-1013-b) TaxID=523794 RepID=C7NBG3_LEPBD|nr:hypothetical protein [Leptotrichia buccalis]ACV39494.1 hypothetical protein Lebu_1622 [Leptotrichia buccalis C-1013-b]
MIIKFSYYNDEDFGLTAFSEIEFSQKEIFENKKNKNEYIKYLVTGIMEDFPYEEIIDDFLLKLEKIETAELKEIIWDGQAFQHKINKETVEFEHTIFGICEEYPIWSCKFEEYKRVLEGWEHFLKMEYSLESEVEVKL